MENNIPNNPEEREKIINAMLTDQSFRRELVTDSHTWFFYYYFPHYIKCEMAPFHSEMFAITEDTNMKTAVVVAFRGSAKSSLFTLSFPIWAILGKQQIKHVVILSSNQQKAQLFLQSIKRELETNRMLQLDLGRFKEEKGEWNSTSLYLPKYDARITIASSEQSIRGIRHKEHRPQLIIIDDIEDIDSVKTKESRDKIDQWFMGEVLPAGDASTRVIIVGNLLHNDSVIKRIQKRIDDKTMSGIYRSYPLLDSTGKATWPGKYPDQAAIDAERAKGYTEVVWRREYLLEIVPEEDQIINENDIHYYDEIPPLENYKNYRKALTGVDLAISEQETSDYTAIVPVQVFGTGIERVIYVLPNVVNERLSALAAVGRVNEISRMLGNGVPTEVVVEAVGYQAAFVELLKEKEIPATGFPIAGHDKRSRLMSTAPLIQTGRIMFPKQGCEKLLQQIFGFGVEKHDDLLDALTLIVMKLLKDDGDMTRLVVPTTTIPPHLSPAEAEKSIDLEIMTASEAARSDYTPAMSARQKAVEQNRKDAEYWKTEELQIFQKMMRGY